MHVISRKRLVQFGEGHSAAVKSLDAWFRLMKARRFANWADLKETFGTADVFGEGLVCFDIGGNKYRLIANVRYTTDRNMGSVWIRHVFTHAEYDRWSKKR